MADGAVPLDGRAGIVVDGTPCALTTIGHDNTGELVGSPLRVAVVPPLKLPL